MLELITILGCVAIASFTILYYQYQDRRFSGNFNGNLGYYDEFVKLKEDVNRYIKVIEGFNSVNPSWINGVNNKLNSIDEYKKKVDALVAKAGFGL